MSQLERIQGYLKRRAERADKAGHKESAARLAKRADSIQRTLDKINKRKDVDAPPAPPSVAALPRPVVKPGLSAAEQKKKAKPEKPPRKKK